MRSICGGSVIRLLGGGAFCALMVLALVTPSLSGGSATPVSEDGNTKRYRRGRNLYRQNCAACHGFDRRGNPPQIPSLVNIDERRSKSYVLEVIRNGRGMMPPFRYLSKEEREAIVYYLFHADEREE